MQLREAPFTFAIHHSQEILYQVAGGPDLEDGPEVIE